MIETNNHFVQSFSLGIPVNRISVLCFEYFASFLDGEILINCLELNLLQYQNFFYHILVSYKISLHSGIQRFFLFGLHSHRSYSNYL
ncbi:hypothetical protein Avbf_05428 [Armadillidium vulgare]|nr:hypothetical protein Avbf_05428 [Armadillidium vulgare]